MPLSVATVVATILVGCGGSEPGLSSPESHPATSAPSTTPAEPAVSPLTGVPITTPPPARPALIVKIDNSRPARPQVGLASADMVVEELVEGGMTRLAAFYFTRLPAVVGPVRSLRTSDIPIVAPTQGLLVASGGAARVKRAVAAEGVRTVLSGPGFYRDRNRRAPYNLMVRPTPLAQRFADLPPPPSYFDWADSAARPTGGRAATKVAIRFSAGHTTTWSFQPGVGWLRAGDLGPPGDRFAATNVLVLRVRIQDAGYRDPAGNPVPETVLAGTGEAVLFHDGKAIPARWTKAGAAETITLGDVSGRPLAMPPGHTWVELVPVAATVNFA